MGNLREFMSREEFVVKRYEVFDHVFWLYRDDVVTDIDCVSDSMKDILKTFVTERNVCIHELQRSRQFDITVRESIYYCPKEEYYECIREFFEKSIENDLRYFRLLNNISYITAYVSNFDEEGCYYLNSSDMLLYHVIGEEISEVEIRYDDFYKRFVEYLNGKYGDLFDEGIVFGVNENFMVYVTLSDSIWTNVFECRIYNYSKDMMFMGKTTCNLID